MKIIEIFLTPEEIEIIENALELSAWWEFDRFEQRTAAVISIENLLERVNKIKE